MDVLENLETVEQLSSFRLKDRQVPEEIIYNEITRVHLIFFIVGMLLLMFFLIL